MYIMYEEHHIVNKVYVSKKMGALLVMKVRRMSTCQHFWTTAWICSMAVSEIRCYFISLLDFQSILDEFLYVVSKRASKYGRLREG